VSLREKLVGLPCTEDTVGCEVGQIRPAFGSIGKSNLDSVVGEASLTSATLALAGLEPGRLPQP
jgi:hypothetical protein